MIIGACGFGSTGSSAVSDYLSEFENVQVLDQLEFTWVSGVDGLIDLDYHLNHPHNRTTDSIYAIHRFKKRVNNTLRGYRKNRKVDPDKFEESAEKFLDSITQVKWNWYIGSGSGLFEKTLQRLAKKQIAKIERRKGHQIKCWPMRKYLFLFFLIILMKLLVNMLRRFCWRWELIFQSPLFLTSLLLVTILRHVSNFLKIHTLLWLTETPEIIMFSPIHV